MSDHDHDHGTGPGQHVHEGWMPDRMIERMKRNGFCGTRVGESVCLNLADKCQDHR